MLIPRRKNHRFLFLNSPSYSCGVGLVNKSAAKQLTIFLVAVMIITTFLYWWNYWFWTYIPNELPVGLTPHDGLLFEGPAVLLIGVLFLLGSGGIDAWSIRAAVLGSAADVLYPKEEDQKAPGPKRGS
jgi:hypothetical protein